SETGRGTAPPKRRLRPRIATIDYMALARRQFLVASLSVLAPTRAICASFAQGLDAFGVSAPPCKDDAPTPSRGPDTTFKAGSPERTSLVDPATSGVPLDLAGTVIGLTCGRIKGARIDIWQADARGIYDTAGFRFRGHQLTNADGQYHFATIVPGAAVGRAP